MGRQLFARQCDVLPRVVIEIERGSCAPKRFRSDYPELAAPGRTSTGRPHRLRTRCWSLRHANWCSDARILQSPDSPVDCRPCEIRSHAAANRGPSLDVDDHIPGERLAGACERPRAFTASSIRCASWSSIRAVRFMRQRDRAGRVCLYSGTSPHPLPRRKCPHQAH